MAGTEMVSAFDLGEDPAQVGRNRSHPSMHKEHPCAPADDEVEYSNGSP